MLPSGTSITFYKSAADATENAAAIKQAVADYPGRGAIRTKGTRVYWLANPRDLTKDERAAFRELVSDAEAAL